MSESDPTNAGGDDQVPLTEEEQPYVESVVIMTTVRVVAPFLLTYGLFLTFHGADSPGGSFQGGIIIGATVLMIAFAYGIEPTREWVRNRTVVALAAGGTAIFTLVGLVPILAGRNFLEYQFYVDLGIIDTPKWGLEAIEIGGVAPIVAGVVIGLFFVIAAGLRIDVEQWYDHAAGPAPSPPGDATDAPGPGGSTDAPGPNTDSTEVSEDE